MIEASGRVKVLLYINDFLIFYHEIMAEGSKVNEVFESFNLNYPGLSLTRKLLGPQDEVWYRAHLLGALTSFYERLASIATSSF